MPLSVAELQTVLQDLFFDTADRLARETGFCQRVRKLPGAVFAQSLVFCLLENPDASLDDFSLFAFEHLGVDASAQAFDDRFTPQAACLLRQLFFEALDRSFNSTRAALLPLLRRFQGVYVRDGVLIRLPACLAGLFPGRKGHGPAASGAAVKLVLEMEVATGQFTAVSELVGRANEKTAEAAWQPLPPGALLLEDMGFFSGERLQMYIKQGVYILTRIPVWTVMYTPKGKPLNLVKLLRRAKGHQLQRQVRILHKDKVLLRLLAVRVPEKVAEERRERVRREAKERGRAVSQKKLELCAWNVLLSNAPRAMLSLWEACDLRRVRWQVELVFKLFKSEGGLERTRSENPWRVLSEMYAKLLAMVVQQWLLLAAGYVMLKHSARRAARRVRQRAGEVVRALNSLEGLGWEVVRLHRVLRRHCTIKRRRCTPSTYDRLAALDPQGEHLAHAA